MAKIQIPWLHQLKSPRCEEWLGNSIGLHVKVCLRDQEREREKGWQEPQRVQAEEPAGPARPEEGAVAAPAVVGLWAEHHPALAADRQGTLPEKTQQCNN